MPIVSLPTNHVVRRVRLPRASALAVLAAAALALLITGTPTPAAAQTPSNNTTLSSVTVDGAAVPSFASSRFAAHYGVAHDVSQVTVAGTANTGTLGI